MATNKFTVEKLSAQPTYDVNKDDGLLSVQENTGTEIDPVYEQRKIAFEDFRNLFQFGVEVYDTRDDSGDPSLPRFLPTTGVAGTSYKVERDPITSRNGYYGWSDYTSDYYYAASLNIGVIEEGNVDAVSGDTTYDYIKAHSLRSKFRLTTSGLGNVKYEDGVISWRQLYLIDSESGKRMYVVDSSGDIESSSVTLSTNLALYVDISDFQNGIANANIELKYKSWNTLSEGQICVGICWNSTSQDHQIGEIFDIIDKTQRRSNEDYKNRYRFATTTSGYIRNDNGVLRFKYLYLIDTGSGKRLYVTDGTNPYTSEGSISLASTQMLYFSFDAFLTQSANTDIVLQQKSWTSAVVDDICVGLHFSATNQIFNSGIIYDIADKELIYRTANDIQITRRSGHVNWSYDSDLKTNTFEFNGTIYATNPDGDLLTLTGSPVVIGENEFAYIDEYEWANTATVGTIAIQVASNYPTANAFKGKKVIASCSRDANYLSYVDGALADLARGEQSENRYRDVEVNLEKIQSNYKLAAIENGEVEQLVVMLEGDSITHVVDEFSKYAYFVAKELRDKYGNAGGGFFSFGKSNGTFMNSVDSDDATIVRSGAIDYSNALQSTAKGVDISDAVLSTGATMVLDVLTNVTNLVIHYFKQSGGGQFRYRIDAGTWTTVDTDDTEGLGLVDITLTEGAYELEIEALSSITLMGVDMQNNAIAGVRVHKMGCRGLDTEEAVSVDSTVFEDGVSALSPDIITINLGTNDSSTNFSTYYLELLDRLNNAVPLADKCIIAPNSNPSKDMTLFRDLLHKIAVDNSLPIVNLIPIFGDATDMANYNSMYDSVHPTKSGGKLIANTLLRKIWKQ